MRRSKDFWSYVEYFGPREECVSIVFMRDLPYSKVEILIPTDAFLDFTDRAAKVRADIQELKSDQYVLAVQCENAA